MSQNENLFTENSTLDQILETPGAEEVLIKYGVPCLGCPMLQSEVTELKIGEVCKMYDIDKEGLLEELNTATNK